MKLNSTRQDMVDALKKDTGSHYVVESLTIQKKFDQNTFIDDGLPELTLEEGYFGLHVLHGKDVNVLQTQVACSDMDGLEELWQATLYYENFWTLYCENCRVARSSGGSCATQ